MLDIVRSNTDKTQSGAARVFTFFRDRLLSGELKAGDRLLAERGVKADTSMMSRFFRRLGVTLKKRRSSRASGIVRR
jgi:transposase